MIIGNIYAIPRIDPAMIEEVLSLESVRPGLFQHLLDSFDRKFEGVLSTINMQIAADDSDALRIAIHSLIGSAGSIGAKRLSEMARCAERAAKGDPAAGPLCDHIRALQSEFLHVRDDLRKISNEHCRIVP